MLVGGDEKMILYNDLEPTEKIKIYDTGYSLQTDEDKNSILVDYRVGDIYVPKIKNNEALAGVASDFLSCIENNTTPVSSSQIGLDIVKLLEAAQESIGKNGAEVMIK